MLKITDNLAIPIREFEFRYSRSPGPGGQNVNKVNTKVTLRWQVDKCELLPEDLVRRLKKKYARLINKEGVLLVTSHRFRDQGRNVADCLTKLKELVLAVAKAPKVRKKTKPSRASKFRRLESKKRNSEKKQSRRSPGMD